MATTWISSELIAISSQETIGENVIRGLDHNPSYEGSPAASSDVLWPEQAKAKV